MVKFDFSKRDGFGSKFGVFTAAAGSAIGLGNIWRFPYILGEYGGGAFLVIYLLFVVFIGITLMLSEFIIGRSAQRNPVGAFKKLAPGTLWHLVGLLGVGTVFMILAFYAIVAGWTLEYVYRSVINGFEGQNQSQLEQMFDGFSSNFFRQLIWFLVFMLLTVWIVISGVKNGIERYTKVLMPLLFLILIILCVRAVTLPGASEGLRFLFKPDLSKITGVVVLVALGQAFFSLSIGMGTLITYGSYIGKNENLLNTAVKVSMADTFIAILAGIAIFPAVFAFGFDPAEGTGLVYKILPAIFQKMPGGYIFSIFFFVLLGVAALTSTISMLEVIVAYFSEELNMTRKFATWVSAALVSVLGIIAAKSGTVFSGLENITLTVLLPLGGLLIVLFLGWYFGVNKTREEITNNGTIPSKLFPVFMFLVKFLAPVAIAVVFLYGLGVF